MPSTSRTTRDTGLVDELQRSHRFTLGVLVSVLVISLLTSGFLLGVSQPRITGYVDLAREARDVHEAMLDQETGLRGYLATGQPTFLEPYRAGTAGGRTAVASLLHDVDKHRELVSPVVGTLLARQRWEEWASHVLASARPTRSEAALTALLQQGKRRFDDYRRSYIRTTDLIFAGRVRALQQQTESLVAVLSIYLSAVAVCGTVTMRRRRRLRRVILDPIDDLHDTITALRSGDLSARAGRTTVPELAEIGLELGRLSDDLARAGDEAAEREQGLALAARRFETLVRVGREIAGSLSVRYVAQTVTTAATELLDAPSRLWIRHEDQHFRVVAQRREDGPVALLPDELDAPEVVLRAAADATVVTSDGTRAYPLVLAGRVTAVLEAHHESLDHSTEQVLSALLSTAAAALESAHLHSSAREQADHDALTRLLNRRRFEVDVDEEWQRCRRYGRPLSLVMLDLDHFKRLNDEHGHLIGDHALREAAAAIAGALRSCDTAYRFGGEEFVVLLRETGHEDARAAAERLREAVAAVEVPDRPTIRLTTSAGVASRRAQMSHHSDLVAVADLALYQAKRLGRDRVATSDDLEPVVPDVLSTLPAR